MKTFGLYAVMAAMLAGAAPAMAQAPDVIASFTDDGGSNYFLSSFTPASANLGATGLGNPNPTLNMVIGKRYQITASPAHPFVISKLGALDTDLLIQGPSVGTFEGDPAVNLVDPGTGTYTFTLTPALAAAMQNFAGYHCQAHPVDMRGYIFTNSAPSNHVWPSGTDTFENALLTTSVATITTWTIVTGGPAYTATIANTPAAMPGQVAGSTRWLKVVDTDSAGANRVYAPNINAAPAQVKKYKFTFPALVESIAAGTTVLWVSQHDVSSVYTNVAGLELTDSGVNVIIVGTTDGGIGTSGASVRTPLYAFADSGGFGLNNWVTLSYEIDLTVNFSVTATALGSNGVTTKTATLPGVVFTNPLASPQRFRHCIRNNAAGSQSTINYDNVALLGTPVTPTGVSDWNLFASNGPAVSNPAELQAAAIPAGQSVESKLFNFPFITTQCPKGDQCTCGK